MTPQIKSALNLLRQYETTAARYEKINKMLAEGDADFASRVNPIDDTMLTSMISLIDEVLGDGLASYYLLECGKAGKIILADGTVLPIRSVDDIEAYLSK